MTLPSLVSTTFSSLGVIIATMTVTALIEAGLPLHPRGPAYRAHLGPNLGLTFITFATNIFLNIGLLMLVEYLAARGFGLIRWASLNSISADVVGILALDFSFHVAHVLMHKIPAFWRVHRVHHTDAAVDVTTTIRQHPIEGVIRYVFMAAFACLFGVSVRALVIYRLWSVINGFLEHANLKVPRWLDRILSLVTTWPNVHKLHHSRDPSETDTNYGNIFVWFDRIFSTYTPSWKGEKVAYGLEGFDDPESQRLRALMALPFRRRDVPATEAGLLPGALLSRPVEGVQHGR